ncbi:MAG: single-stranded-DNA-specific exonuclease RecJ [Candidatus Aminicenantes bacterium]|nr:single-stranded-DNA-specific exonuclease RecJ [Candidatus Aminicenantes bacterium]
MDNTIWVYNPPSEEACALARELGIPLEIAQILVNRGIRDPETAHTFLYGELGKLHNPYLMKGMKEAVERIKQAISQGEKILVFGDYDVDGVLSVVILRRALGFLGADVDYFIPDRLKYGYGIKEEFIDIVLEREAGLVISVDCGIKAVPFTRRAKVEGIDVIITDHHLPGETLPEAEAILNPVLEDSGYPDKGLAGIGVVFKLIQALSEEEEMASQLAHYMKFVSIGTIADVSELRGENRLFVRNGLEDLGEDSDIGLSSLLDICGLKGRKVSVGDVGFRIGPRINAAGRMGMADLAVRLFFSDSWEESVEIASRLDSLNAKRQKVQERTYNQALNMIQSRGLDKRYKFLILGCEEWHRGVVGIVASKLKDFFHRPVLLFTYEDEKACGSGRSISEFPIIECLDECKDLLSTYGGHSMAVGCVLPLEKMTVFKENVNAIANARLSDEDLKRKIYVDSKIEFSDISSDFLGNYSRLSPFGVGNPTPIFLTKGAEVARQPQRIKGKHSKFLLKQKGCFFEALGWDRSDWALEYQRGERIDVAYSLQFSEYLGETKMSLSVEDIKRQD